MVIIYATNHRKEIIQKTIRYRNNATLIMFGDSHTARGDWCFLLNRYDVLNNGYSSYTSEQLLNILRTTLNEYNVEYCFVQCGGNDINSWCYDRENTLKNLTFMVEEIIAQDITPVIQSLIYRCHDPNYNSKVDSLNILLARLASERKVAFIDINKDLTANKGSKYNFGKDNIHLSKSGYKIWAGMVKDYLEETIN